MSSSFLKCFFYSFTIKKLLWFFISGLIAPLGNGCGIFVPRHESKVRSLFHSWLDTHGCAIVSSELHSNRAQHSSRCTLIADQGHVHQTDLPLTIIAIILDEVWEGIKEVIKYCLCKKLVALHLVLNLLQCAATGTWTWNLDCVLALPSCIVI